MGQPRSAVGDSDWPEPGPHLSLSSPHQDRREVGGRGEGLGQTFGNAWLAKTQPKKESQTFLLPTQFRKLSLEFPNFYA